MTPTPLFPDGPMRVTFWHDNPSGAGRPYPDGWHSPGHTRWLVDTWGAIIGPTATVAAGILTHAEHASVAELAAVLGVGERTARDALTRLCRFGLARPTDDGIALRAVFPPLTVRQRQRLPATHPAHLAGEGAA